MSSRIAKNQFRMFPRRRRGEKRGVATAIGAMLFFVIAFQIIAFMYEVNQVNTEMVAFDIEKSREFIQIGSIGFNDRSPSSLDVSSGQIISGDVLSLKSMDTTRLILGSQETVITLHPSGYNLIGPTQLVSGTVSNLASNDTSYMIFRSYIDAAATIAQDTFADVAGTNLENHTPDVGTSWIVTNAGSLIVSNIGGPLNELEHDKDSLITSARENTSIGDDNMNVTLSVKGRQAGDYIGPAARIPTGTFDGDDMYLGRLVFDGGEKGDLEIVKIVAGVLTVLGTANTDFLSEQFVKITLEVTAGQQRLFACTPVPCNPTLRITTNEPDTTLQGNTHAGLRSLSTVRATGADDYLSESLGVAASYTSEVEFMGSGGIADRKFDWFVDSSWTVGMVNVTIQLFSYANNQYVQDISSYNGRAYLNYESTPTPNTDEMKTKMITSDGGDFFDSGGNWKIKVKGEKQTNTQFDLKVDLVDFSIRQQETDWHGVFSITEAPGSIKGLEITYTGHSSSSIGQEIYIYNFTGAIWERLAEFTLFGVESSVGPLPNGSLSSDYISGASQVLVSVNSTSSGSFNTYVNYLHLRILPVTGSGAMTVEFINTGGQDVHLVDLWFVNGSQRILMNSDSSPSFNANVFPGGSYSYSINFDWVSGETYTVKVISERGSIWSRITSP